MFDDARGSARRGKEGDSGCWFAYLLRDPFGHLLFEFRSRDKRIPLHAGRGLVGLQKNIN